MKANLVIASALMIFGGAFAANAGLIDVAFYNSGFDSPYAAPTGPDVLGMSSDVWNSIDAGTSPNPASLVDTGGNVTGASVAYTAEGGVQSLILGTQPDPNLTNNYLFSDAADGFNAIQLLLSGLVDNGDYELVLYVASNDANGGDRSLTGTANGVAFSATGDPQSTFINGENVVELAVTADGTGSISILESNPGNSGGEIDLNGLQLENAPEPASLGLLMLGSIMGLRRRR